MSAQTTAPSSPLTEIEVIDAITALDTEVTSLAKNYRGAEAQQHVPAAEALGRHARQWVQRLTEQITTNLSAQTHEALVQQVRQEGVVVRSNASTQTMAETLARRIVSNSEVTTLQRKVEEKVSFLRSQASAYRHAHAVLDLWAEKTLVFTAYGYETDSVEAKAYGEALDQVGLGYAEAIKDHGRTPQALSSLSNQVLGRLGSHASRSTHVRVGDLSAHMATNAALIEALSVIQAGLGAVGVGTSYRLSSHYDAITQRERALFPTTA